MQKKIYHEIQYWKVFFLFIGWVFFLTGFAPYTWLKPLADAFAKDGLMESFTPEVYQGLHWVCLVLGLFFLALAFWIHYRRAQAQHAAAFLHRKFHAFLYHYPKSIPDFFRDILTGLPQNKEWIFITLVLAAAAGLRYFLLFRPLEFDEAYTYNEFARHSIAYITSEYYVVNNHIFHTLLVKLTTTCFGNQPWAIRLPVYFAGIAVVFFGYWLASRSDMATLGAVVLKEM